MVILWLSSACGIQSSTQSCPNERRLFATVCSLRGQCHVQCCISVLKRFPYAYDTTRQFRRYTRTCPCPNLVYPFVNPRVSYVFVTPNLCFISNSQQNVPKDLPEDVPKLSSSGGKAVSDSRGERSFSGSNGGLSGAATPFTNAVRRDGSKPEVKPTHSSSKVEVARADAPKPAPVHGVKKADALNRVREPTVEKRHVLAVKDREPKLQTAERELEESSKAVEPRGGAEEDEETKEYRQVLQKLLRPVKLERYVDDFLASGITLDILPLVSGVPWIPWGGKGIRAQIVVAPVFVVRSRSSEPGDTLLGCSALSVWDQSRHPIVTPWIDSRVLFGVPSGGSCSCASAAHTQLISPGGKSNVSPRGVVFTSSPVKSRAES